MSHLNALRSRIVLAVLAIACAVPVIWLLCRDYPSILKGIWEDGWMADPLAGIVFAMMSGVVAGSVHMLIAAAWAWPAAKVAATAGVVDALIGRARGNCHAVKINNEEKCNDYW